MQFTCDELRLASNPTLMWQNYGYEEKGTPVGRSSKYLNKYIPVLIPHNTYFLDMLQIFLQNGKVILN